MWNKIVKRVAILLLCLSVSGNEVPAPSDICTIYMETYSYFIAFNDETLELVIIPKELPWHILQPRDLY